MRSLLDQISYEEMKDNTCDNMKLLEKLSLGWRRRHLQNENVLRQIKKLIKRVSF